MHGAMVMVSFFRISAEMRRAMVPFCSPTSMVMQVCCGGVSLVSFEREKPRSMAVRLRAMHAGPASMA